MRKIIPSKKTGGLKIAVPRERETLPEKKEEAGQRDPGETSESVLIFRAFLQGILDGGAK